MIDTILDPQIWLVLVAVVHAGWSHPPNRGGRHEQARERLVPTYSHDAWYMFLLEGRDGKDDCGNRRPGLGLVRHHMRAGPGVEPGQDPDDDELEGQRPSTGTLGHSGVERPLGLRMGLRR